MDWNGFPDRCHPLFCYREEVGGNESTDQWGGTFYNPSHKKSPFRSLVCSGWPDLTLSVRKGDADSYYAFILLAEIRSVISVTFCKPKSKLLVIYFSKKLGSIPVI